MNDNQLNQAIQQCQRGEPAGFEHLAHVYGSRLYRYFLRLTASPADADDLLQDLFVRLMEKMKTYHHHDRFERWIFTVAANLARDHFRRTGRTNALSLDAQTNPHHDRIAAHLADDRPSPVEHATNNEQQDRLQDALNHLAHIDRDIIVLRHYSGLTFKELAHQFQMPIGTVLAKVHRGLKRLQEILKDHD